MTTSRPAVEIRGNRYTLMTVMLRTANHAEAARALHARVRQAPAFLFNVPVIVDFSTVELPANYNFNLLFKVIRQQNLLPVAVRGLPEHMKDSLQAVGVPVVEVHNPRPLAEKENSLTYTGVTLGKPGVALVIDRSLRQGERCYAQEADLIVIGDCRTDNELIADGHIHVYGTLRGKAVAGFQGDRSARIFCQALEADRLSVAGVELSAVASFDALSAPFHIQIERDKLSINSVP